VNQPDRGPAHAMIDRANAFYASGALAQAGPLYRELLKQFPRHLFLLNRMAELTFRRNNFKASVEFLRKSLDVSPEQPLVWLGLGTSLAQAGDTAAALDAYDRATALKPDLAQAHLEKSILLSLTDRPSEALVSVDLAIAAQPDLVQAVHNRGQVLKVLDRYEDAVAAFRHSIEIKPDLTVAYFSLGILLGELHRFEEALASFDAALAIDPAYSEAAGSRAELLLLMGDYAQGWKLYEVRLKTRFRREFLEQAEFAGCPFWSGAEPLDGKTIVVRPEVGLGDFIMFARYVSMIQQRGANVVLYAPEPLTVLFGSMRPQVQVVKQGETPPPADFQCPIMDLPRVFGTTLATVPSSIPYLFADPEKQAVWRQRLGPKVRPRIGLMWSGKGQRNIDRTALRRRTMPLDALRPVLDLPLEFHALQKEILAIEEAGVAGCANLTRHDHELDDLSDTAALIAEMDLVISIDTSVAHLAGAMGKPLWVALPYSADYRWTRDPDRTVWYPAAHLFRQAQPGGWDGVVNRIATRLAAEFGVPAQDQQGRMPEHLTVKVSP
jgi:tetratricopeptide (TPR) repeat protein